MSCSNKVICSGFNPNLEINVDLTPIKSHEAEACEDGDELGEVEGDGCFVNFAKFRDGHEVVVVANFGADLVHLGNEFEAQHQGEGQDGAGDGGHEGAGGCGIAEGGARRHHNRKFKISDVERPDELGVHRVVVFQNEQGNRPKQEIGGHSQHGHREKQRNLLCGEHD